MLPFENNEKNKEKNYYSGSHIKYVDTNRVCLLQINVYKHLKN